jgi:hypothetical protein
MIPFFPVTGRSAGSHTGDAIWRLTFRGIAAGTGRRRHDDQRAGGRVADHDHGRALRSQGRAGLRILWPIVDGRLLR